jgi:2-dehydro-3-deoxyphosphogluconate aldolase / (4S)-4-hydroxy-2-oxoglutarate aldolase
MQMIYERIAIQKILPLFTHEDIRVAIQAATICYNGGLQCFEFTNRKENAPEVFRLLKNHCRQHLPGMQLGIGTIRNATEAALFPEADFYVSPFITPALMEFMHAKKLQWIPGCSTASEIAMAVEGGVAMVKIFPANYLGGPPFVKMMKEIFTDTKIIATGGMKANKAELQTWFDNGADAVGIGGALFGKNCSELENTAAIIYSII